MYRSSAFRLFFAALAVQLGGCARVQSGNDAGIIQQASYRPTKGRVTDHVIVVSIDGLRPDAIAKYRAPTLLRLMREGRYSLSAQTIDISLTLPSHTSMLTGVDSDQHGITWNSDRTGQAGHVAVPTIFGIARTAGFTTAAFFSKTKFNQLDAPGSIDHVSGPKGGKIPWNAGKTVGNVRRHLATTTPNLTFIHLADADFAGHSFGWMGRMYGMAVRQADSSLARIIVLADERFGAGRYSLIVTADHGGHGRTHGSTDKRDTTIPWIVWGAGVQPGDTLTGIRTMDTAATVLWMLGLDAPPAWTGRSLATAFSRS